MKKITREFNGSEMIVQKFINNKITTCPTQPVDAKSNSESGMVKFNHNNEFIVRFGIEVQS